MTYAVDTYEPSDDHGRDGEWTEVASRVPLWGLRPILRGLESQGYDRQFSIYVRREIP